MDAFFASVEQRDFPQHQGKPVIVGGTPERRGVVAACSYEARQFGIHSAMSSARAKRLCPDAIFLPPRFEVYRECSQQIHRVFQSFTHIIEPLSLDEAYLDVSECQQHQGSATLIAQAIKQKIKQTLNLTASAGVSYNKFLAKLASDMDKPDGLTVIKPEAAQSLIDQLPIRRFFGVGKATEAKMHKYNIYKGADLKHLSRRQLQAYFGKTGNYYYHIARGMDERPVRRSRQRKSIGKETTFAQDLTDKQQIWQTLQAIVVRLSDSLQNKNIKANTVTLKVKYHDFVQITRSKTISEGIFTAQQIEKYLPSLLQKTDVGQRPIRLIGISLSSLSEQAGDDSVSQATTQLGFF